MTARLVAVEINVPDNDRLLRAIATYGYLAQKGPTPFGIVPAFVVGTSGVMVRHDASQPGGLRRLMLAVADRRTTVIRMGWGAASLPYRLSGLEIDLIGESADSRPRHPADAPAQLDHVALAVEDLEASAARWAALCGVEPEMMGAHPISDGAFDAARLDLGGSMVELLSPAAGRTSPISERLEASGEGPVTLALPAVDLDSMTRALTAIGTRVVQTEHHRFVHPADAGGVLVQLTPRVRH